MTNQTNYRSVKVPEGKRPEEYDHNQRRAELLKVIEKAGHPDAINQAEMARRYDVNRSTIHRDMKRLREFALDEIDEERVDHISQTVYQTAIQELMADDEYDRAARVLESWNSWLFDRGKVEKEPEKREVDANVDVTKKEAKVYAGVDLTSMPGVDESRIVGAHFDSDDDEDDANSHETTATSHENGQQMAGESGSGVDIPLGPDETPDENGTGESE